MKKEAGLGLVSPEEAKRFFDMSGIIFVALDRRGRVALINNKGCEALGMSHARILGADWFDKFVLKKDLRRTRAAFKMLISGNVKPAEQYENRILVKGGKERHIMWHNTVLRDGAGVIVGTLSSGIDITERKREEERLKRQSLRLEGVVARRTLELNRANKDLKLHSAMVEASRNYLDSIINSVGNPIFVKDRKHRWVLLNDALCKFMGYPRKMLIGKSDYEFFPKKQADVFWAKDEVVFGTGKTNINEELLTDAKGKTRNILTKKVLYKNDAGEKYIVGIISDITDIRKQEEEIQKLKEEQIRRIFASSHDSIIMGDLRGRITDFNASALKLLGCPSRKELMGKNYYSFFAKRDIAQAKENLRRTLAHGAARSVDYTIVKKNGTELDVEISASPLRDAGCRPVGFVAIMKDITEEKKAEAALKESEAKYRDLVNMLPQSVFESCLDGKITYFNNLAFASFGYTAGDFGRGLNAFRMFVRGDGPMIRANLERVLKGASLRGFESTALRKDGSTFPALMYASAILRNSVPIGFRGIVLDMTGLKKAEKEAIQGNADLKKAYADLKSLSMVREEFINTISHALKTPLTSIMSFISLLRDGKLGPMDCAQLDALMAIESESNRLFMLVNNILDASKVETGTFLISKQRADMRSIVDICAKRLSTSARDHGNTITVIGPKPLYGKFDRSWIERALDNLVSNSIKFTKDGQITIRLCKVRGGIKFSITDTGRGMSKEVLSSMFEKFYQGQKQTGTGTGIGLYICKRVISAHSGRIKAESPGPGKGSTIWFTLPD